ncbi:sensor histidine kinase [Paractinoplanes lichenicola]|uniref:sensor histidine kinase n=1 Tax=Paractinoplanes lichenicola TaxID=2802976 RepID=UPI0027DDC5E7|nr:histidine kinase [Actinoplanes lichenicola]
MILLVAGLSSTGLAAVGYPLLVVGGLALGERRRAPVAVLIVTAACAAGYQAAGFDAFAVAYLIAVYSAMRAGRWVVTVVTSAVLLVALPAAALASGASDLGEAFARSRSVLELAWLAAAGAAGEALRQAEQRADEAERTREAVARRRADEERLHIARELHDSLTHQISVIKVQSEAAVHVAERRGEEVPEALLAIRDAGRAATRDLRATLEALRDDVSVPPHGIDQIAELVEQAERAGTATTLTFEGERPEVPFAVDRTAYRIVQESLTNVARHAPAANVTVHIAWQPGALTIRVKDDGAAKPKSAQSAASTATGKPGLGASGAGAGKSGRGGSGALAGQVRAGVGLVGMRERVAALGGSIRAGPCAGGGFAVEVELPWGRV